MNVYTTKKRYNTANVMQEPEKTATVKVTVVLLCCSMSVLSHEHALNACYLRSANWAFVGHRRNGIRTTGAESRMPTWYRRCPVAKFDNAHLAHLIGCSDSGDCGGSNGRRSGVDDWLVVTSISVPVAVVFGRYLESLAVSTQTVADCLKKLQPGVRGVVESQCTT